VTFEKRNGRFPFSNLNFLGLGYIRDMASPLVKSTKAHATELHEKNLYASLGYESFEAMLDDRGVEAAAVR
jgi:hypothetical protein